MTTLSQISYQNALALFTQPDNTRLLNRIQRGIEKEGLRCTSKGMISQKPHPKGLGSTLTHPSITTDYSEALLEFITPVFASAHEAQAYLNIAHRFAYKQLDGELIWPASMPCIVNGEMSVPIADYGSSNVGRLKHVYRHGLWHRYGRIMQTISGIHYNFSMPDDIWPVLAKADGMEIDSENPRQMQNYISARYFAQIRNFRRYSWLLMYLFGASPAVCETFLAGREHKLDRINNHTLYAPYATSLRMSDLGYQNNAQDGLRICHNSVSSYVETLGDAMHQVIPAYDEIGVRNDKGEYMQLNTNLLQIENEYYSDIRPKRVARNGEKPLQALAQYGVEYIEVRCTDVNPFLPEGIDVPQMHFMDLFLTWCLLEPSDGIEDEEYLRNKRNLHKAVMEGRRPGLMLERGDKEETLQQWGLDLIELMRPLAKAMDEASGTVFHTDALNQQQLKLADPELTPSARIVRHLRDTGEEFAIMTLNLAEQHRKTLSENLSSTVLAEWQKMASDSLQQQKDIEDADNISFDEYLQQYLAR
ncbi:MULTISPECIES: glutamate--cysteine ligase [unclassified Thalassolituus]|uniref:glutamate--cysteine ligase n=1 Tax=unclassified Thalassolituus TaxID=2624967 RepID=UPI0025FE546E|nr:MULTISPECIES: glutamate--cysteine ligase [unclassified Thalassolituus]